MNSDANKYSRIPSDKSLKRYTHRTGSETTSIFNLSISNPTTMNKDSIILVDDSSVFDLDSTIKGISPSFSFSKIPITLKKRDQPVRPNTTLEFTQEKDLLSSIKPQMLTFYEYDNIQNEKDDDSFFRTVRAVTLPQEKKQVGGLIAMKENMKKKEMEELYLNDLNGLKKKLTFDDSYEGESQLLGRRNKSVEYLHKPKQSYYTSRQTTREKSTSVSMNISNQNKTKSGVSIYDRIREKIHSFKEEKTPAVKATKSQALLETERSIERKVSAIKQRIKTMNEVRKPLESLNLYQQNKTVNSALLRLFEGDTTTSGINNSNKLFNISKTFHSIQNVGKSVKSMSSLNEFLTKQPSSSKIIPTGILHYLNTS